MKQAERRRVVATGAIADLDVETRAVNRDRESGKGMQVVASPTVPPKVVRPTKPRRVQTFRVLAARATKK